MENFKVAFVGFRHGHIDSLYNKMKESEQYTIVAACEENAEAAAAAKERGIDITFTDFHEMMQQCEFDVLAIGDYFGIRGARAISALVAGKHVIADKPLCTSLAELREIRHLAQTRNLKVGCMLDMRLNANVNAAKAVIDSGRLGEIHAISFGGQHPLSYGTRPNWYFEQGKQGGTINDIAIHGLDAVEYMTGHTITELTAARTWNAFATFAPVVFQDAAQGMFALDNKCGVMFDVSYFAPEKTGFANPFYWRFTIWGRNGVLEFNYADAGCKLYLSGAEAVENIPAAEEGSDYLKIFTQEITAGADLPFGSEHIMEVSEKCLKLQAIADKNR